MRVVGLLGLGNSLDLWVGESGDSTHATSIIAGQPVEDPFTGQFPGGCNLPVAGVANQIVSVQTNSDPTQTAIVRRQSDILRGDQLFKPFGELLYRASKGHSSYNGLTVQFKRNNVNLGTSEHWLDWQNFTSFNAQYTLGRNVGNASGAVTADTGDFDADFGFNASDVRHSFTLTAGYRLWDDANGRSRRDILWGWAISPTVNMRSGLPLVVRLDRPDVVYVAAGNVFGSPAAGRQNDRPAEGADRGMKRDRRAVPVCPGSASMHGRRCLTPIAAPLSAGSEPL